MPIRFAALGDQAVLAYLEDETAAARLAAAARACRDPAWLDIVPAYSSVAIHFDLDRTTCREVEQRLRTLVVGEMPPTMVRRHIIPCCYEMGPDLSDVADLLGLSPQRVVASHSECEYTVYAIGFCPGYPYLGYLPEKLCGLPRLDSPRRRVPAGSVGLTGRQTGIYSLERPGGWRLIGRTPLEVVNIVDNYFPLRVGDRIRFEPIGRARFRRLFGRRMDADAADSRQESHCILGRTDYRNR